MPNNTEIRWKFVEDFEILWRSWGDETVLFHAGSGDIHILNSISTEAIKILRNNLFTSTQLAKRVAISLNLPANTDLFSHMTQLVNTLDKMGLIEPAEP
jgi:PqqD family protein of HPr-rel-A system